MDRFAIHLIVNIHINRVEKDNEEVMLMDLREPRHSGKKAFRPGRKGENHIAGFLEKRNPKFPQTQGAGVR